MEFDHNAPSRDPEQQNSIAGRTRAPLSVVLPPASKARQAAVGREGRDLCSLFRRSIATHDDFLGTLLPTRANIAAETVLRTKAGSSSSEGGIDARSQGNVGRLDGFLLPHVFNAANVEIPLRHAPAGRTCRRGRLGRPGIPTGSGARSARAPGRSGRLLLLDSLLSRGARSPGGNFPHGRSNRPGSASSAAAVACWVIIGEDGQQD